MRKRLRITILFLGVWLLATGWTDLDWMIVANHFQMWNATKPDWEFCPYLTMNWWLAFEFTLARIIIGSILLGIIAAHLPGEKTE